MFSSGVRSRPVSMPNARTTRTSAPTRAAGTSTRGTRGFLALGYLFIRRRNKVAHAWCMGLAVFVSILFLASYLYYHAEAGSTKFTGVGSARILYFVILVSHSLLAAVAALYLVPVTLWRAMRRRFAEHRRIAAWTLPIWFYVSVTGVIVYLMLYHWYAPA